MLIAYRSEKAKRFAMPHPQLESFPNVNHKVNLDDLRKDFRQTCSLAEWPVSRTGYEAALSRIRIPDHILIQKPETNDNGISNTTRTSRLQGRRGFQFSEGSENTASTACISVRRAIPFSCSYSISTCHVIHTQFVSLLTGISV